MNRPGPLGPAWVDDATDRTGSLWGAVLLAGALLVGLAIGVAFVVLGGEAEEVTGPPPEPLSAAQGLPLAADTEPDDGVAPVDVAPSTAGTDPVPSTIVIVETAPTPSTSVDDATTASSPVSTSASPASSTSTTAAATAPTQPDETAAPTTPSSSTTVSTSRPSSSSSQTSTTTRPGPGGDDAAVQRRILELTNAERVEAGCPVLTLNGQLNTAADAHSEDMAARDYFDHVDPEGRGPGDRIATSGYRHRTWAENIAAGYRSAEAVVAGWMNSDGHRRNILNCDFDELGVGYATDPATNNWPYWTQVFGSQR